MSLPFTGVFPRGRTQSSRAASLSLAPGGALWAFRGRGLHPLISSGVLEIFTSRCPRCRRFKLDWAGLDTPSVGQFSIPVGQIEWRSCNLCAESNKCVQSQSANQLFALLPLLIVVQLQLVSPTLSLFPVTTHPWP